MTRVIFGEIIEEIINSVDFEEMENLHKAMATVNASNMNYLDNFFPILGN